ISNSRKTLRKVSASIFKVVFAFEDRPFLITPPSKDNSVLPVVSATTKLIARFAKAGGKSRLPACAVNVSTVENQSSDKKTGMIFPQFICSFVSTIQTTSG